MAGAGEEAGERKRLLLWLPFEALLLLSSPSSSSQLLHLLRCHRLQPPCPPLSPRASARS